MAAELIGRCKCPLCGGVARLSLAKTQLSVLTCNGCNFQGFARSDRSDEKLRALLIADVPAPAAPQPEQAQAAPPAAVKAPAVAAPQTPAPAQASRPGWGIFGG